MDYDVKLDRPNTTIWKDRVKGRKKAGEGVINTVADKIARAKG